MSLNPAHDVLQVYDFGDEDGALYVPNDYYDNLWGPAYKEGARAFSNSWGSSLGYYYSTVSELDEFVYDTDDSIILVAASNDGYTYGDKSIGAPALAKNSLCIGAAENSVPTDTVAYFSSRGPTRDHRLKPDVIAPGDSLLSGKASGDSGLATCQVTHMSGTSMACPAAAGIVLLIRQFLMDGFHEQYSPKGFNFSSYNQSAPSSALVKAMIIASTEALTFGYNTTYGKVKLTDFYAGDGSAAADQAAYNLGTTGVDFHQGFGTIRTSNIIPLHGEFDVVLLESTLPAYSTMDICLTAAKDTSIRTVLVWNDPPGSTYCDYYGRCLVHDLDLEVASNGSRHFPNFGAASQGDYAGQLDNINNGRSCFSKSKET